ncbi:hypothetical protein [Saccharopolyspora oryzae]|uniref:Uncharacterized protein n=1 Tax=Saccharopolyspora oryzae TaxID=2997343 RepID=A0ABT4UWW9_9PSEU|nr:hypothetical protein [Saccharopolyspora oryzae]MDA3626058.1 hypothetical protein [Saccharopolyspora oryzae]
MDSNALLASPPAGDTPVLLAGSSSQSHIRRLLTQRRVIDHGRRTTTACRRAM